ncbi:hypothetical protein PVAP13_6KG084105 [Panicum virgatum]|uniref:Uncharacterized protein n=1 Tax=Panicum virgatum TaxID=38727 RepID=A0A8T0RAT3_PANVG|nr:hypothetical protein PVAP13_6KG084105 [Panicum virgatum]
MEKKEVVAGQSFISPFRPTTTSSLLRSALCSTYLFAMPCLSKWYFLSMPTHLLMSNAHSLTYEQCSLLSDVQCKARICSIPGTLTNPSIQVYRFVNYLFSQGNYFLGIDRKGQRARYRKGVDQKYLRRRKRNKGRRQEGQACPTSQLLKNRK